MSMVKIGYWDPANQRIVRTDGGAVHPMSPQASQASALPAMQRQAQTQAIIPQMVPQAVPQAIQPRPTATTAAPQMQDQTGARILPFPSPATGSAPPATATAAPPATAAIPAPTAWTLPPEDALGAPVALPQVQPPWLPSTWRLASIRPIVREVTVIQNLDPAECGGDTNGGACSLVARAGNVLVAFEKTRQPGQFRYGIAIGLADQSSRSRIVSLLSDGVPLTGSVNSPSRAFRILDVERQTIAPDPTPVPPPQSTVAVPDVGNRPVAEAHAALVTAGLMVAPHDTDGTATGTDPPAGTLVTAGSQVALLIAVPAPIPTPSPMGIWIGLGVIGLFALAKMGRRGEGRPLAMLSGRGESDYEPSVEVRPGDRGEGWYGVITASPDQFAGPFPTRAEARAAADRLLAAWRGEGRPRSLSGRGGEDDDARRTQQEVETLIGGRASPADFAQARAAVKSWRSGLTPAEQEKWLARIDAAETGR